MRAKRLELPTDRLQMLSETSVEAVCAAAQKVNPKVMVVDSIQDMHLEDIQSAPGSVSQVRESAAYLTRFAKQTGKVVILEEDANKDGSLGGATVREHITE